MKSPLQILDPYRWLEDTESEETRHFVQAENNLTFSYLEKAPSRQKLREKLTRSWNFAKSGLPKKRGSRYFIYKNSGIQNQWLLYTAPSLKEVLTSPEVFIDPNTFSKDGTVSLNKIAFSEDGELFAYALAKSGSDWTDIHVKNVSTKEDFPDVIEFARSPSIAWTHDNLGFFYTVRLQFSVDVVIYLKAPP
jgi:prolyl oligopeptidase